MTVTSSRQKLKLKQRFWEINIGNTKDSLIFIGVHDNIGLTVF